EAWGYLREEVIPRLLRVKQESAGIRVWSAGCASGEEPYSVAMLLAEALGLDEYVRRVKIYATDWDEAALQAARRGRFSREVEGIPDELRARYLQAQNGEAVLLGPLRRSIIFGHHDLTEDAPISR